MSKATDEFIGVISEISDQIEWIQSCVVDEHMGVDPENANWADVGTARHLLELLREVRDFVEEGDAV